MRCDDDMRLSLLKPGRSFPLKLLIPSRSHERERQRKMGVLAHAQREPERAMGRYVYIMSLF